MKTLQELQRMTKAQLIEYIAELQCESYEYKDAWTCAKLKYYKLKSQLRKCIK